jgi:hypothetical protein
MGELLDVLLLSESEAVMQIASRPSKSHDAAGPKRAKITNHILHIYQCMQIGQRYLQSSQ